MRNYVQIMRKLYADDAQIMRELFTIMRRLCVNYAQFWGYYAQIMSNYAQIMCKLWLDYAQIMRELYAIMRR